jgi:hypothetical protein
MASSAVAVEERRMSIARVFERAFSTIGSNAVTMFGIAFLFSALPGTLISYGSQLVQQPMVLELGVGGVIAISVVTVLLALVFGMITQGALVRATIAHSEGRKASFGESVMAGLVVVLPLIALGLLLGLAVGIGFLLLIVPGVILYIIWSVASPALVAERSGVFAAFGRSQFLTKGARWKIFALQLVIIIFYWIVSGALGVLLVATYGMGGMATMGQTLPIWYMALNAVIQTVVAAIWGAIQTSLYVELRNWKDGPDAGALADIFA